MLHAPIVMVATSNELSFLKAQLLDAQRLLNLAAGHPLMSKALSCRKNELQERVRQADEQKPSASSESAQKSVPARRVRDVPTL